MRNLFVPIANVERFTAAVARLERRGAMEKQIVLISGDAGLGKSRTGVWWGVHNDAAAVYVKPSATPAWVLSDLVRELGLPPKRSAQDMFAQAVGVLSREPRPIVVDEVEHALQRDVAALDTLRALVDLVEVPLILIGREQTAEKLRRHRQIWRRVAGVAEFRPLTETDVRQLADALVEGQLGDDLVAEVAARSAGLISEVLTLLTYADVAARARPEQTLGLADVRLPKLYVAHRAGRILGMRTAPGKTAQPTAPVLRSQPQGGVGG